jgi:hypothetical protein
MIDFKNATIIKLHDAPGAYRDELEPVLVDGEQIVSSYKAMRDGVVFTNKRIFVINIQGFTGVKKDITSLPYSKIQAFSVETAGVFDRDSELDLWFSAIGKVRFEFTEKTNISAICKIIGSYAL